MFNVAGKSFGRCHIVESLGEGGMASVYKAYDTRLERNVAIKVILPSQQQIPGLVAEAIGLTPTLCR